MNEVPVSRLRELLSYDALDGVVRWINRRGRCRKGSAAGSKDKYGYTTIMVDHRRFFAHRIAWALTFGEWPASELDHINGDPSDNRIGNLRLASRAENAQNLHRPPSRSTSGALGVSRHKVTGKWRAQIGIQGKTVWLGAFREKADAQDAYLKAKARIHPFSPAAGNGRASRG